MPYMVERFAAAWGRAQEIDVEFESWVNESSAEGYMFSSANMHHTRVLRGISLGGRRIVIPVRILALPRGSHLIMLFGEPSFVLGWIFAMIKGHRVWFWVEAMGPGHGKGSRFRQILKRVMFTYCTGVLTPGRDADRYVEKFGISPNKLMRLHHVIDSEQFRKSLDLDRTACEQILGIRSDLKTILFVGRLVPIKNLISLVDAVAELPVQLLIVGSGPEEKNLRSRVSELRIGDRVSFLGFLEGEALCRAMRASDAVALVSHAETYGLVLDEAQAAGLAVITVPQVAETYLRLPSAGFGILAEGNDRDSIFHALNVWLAEDDWGEMQKGMRSAFRTKFTPESWAHELFETVVGFNGNPPGRPRHDKSS